MLRNALPALSNNFISLFKDTSLAAAIAVPELTFYARKINVESFRVIETWLVASLMYVATCYLIAAGLRHVRAAPGDSAASEPMMDDLPASSSSSGSPRWAVLQGARHDSSSISVLAIVLGTLLGIGVGLGLVYGGRAPRFVVRVYRRLCARHAGLRAGAGLLYLLLRSRLPADRVPGRPVRADGVLQLPCRRESARRAAGPAARADRGGEGHRPHLSPDLRLCAGARRLCARRCRPGSTPRPRSSRPRPCCR